jgi:hypothetical protein
VALRNVREGLAVRFARFSDPDEAFRALESGAGS